MMKLRLEHSLAQEAKRIKEQAKKLEPGLERDALMKKARQLDIDCQILAFIARAQIVPGARWH